MFSVAASRPQESYVKKKKKKKNSINQSLGPVKYEDENCKGNVLSSLHQLPH